MTWTSFQICDMTTQKSWLRLDPWCKIKPLTEKGWRYLYHKEAFSHSFPSPVQNWQRRTCASALLFQSPARIMHDFTKGGQAQITLCLLTTGKIKAFKEKIKVGQTEVTDNILTLQYKYGSEILNCKHTLGWLPCTRLWWSHI